MWVLGVIFTNVYVAYVSTNTLIWCKKKGLLSHYKFRNMIALVLIAPEEFYDKPGTKEESVASGSTTLVVQNKCSYWANSVDSVDINMRICVIFTYGGYAARFAFLLYIQFSGLRNLKMVAEDSLIFEINNLNVNGNTDICNKELGYLLFRGTTYRIV